MRHLLSVDDLIETEVDAILGRASELVDGAQPAGPTRLVLATAFFEESLRTRVGFAAAAAALGWATVSVDARREGASSSAESWADTLRTLSGLVDVVVARPALGMDHATVTPIKAAVVLNGGDRGSRSEHPSQALIDLFAIERLRGPAHKLTVALCGDLRMRAARSLRKMLARRGARVVAVSDEGMAADDAGDVEFRQPWQLEDVDVLYVAGMPHGALPLGRRERLLVDEEALQQLHRDAVVLSPMPVIDEITASARRDPRVRFFEANEWSVPVRIAVLEAVTAAKWVQSSSSNQVSSSARPGTLR